MSRYDQKIVKKSRVWHRHGRKQQRFWEKNERKDLAYERTTWFESVQDLFRSKR